MDKTNQNKKEHVLPSYITLPQSLFASQQIKQSDGVDLSELWKAVWSGKLTIVIFSILFAIISVFYALSQPNIYKASVLLAPASSENSGAGLAGLAGQFGGLASLAGINLGGNGGDNTTLALEVIKSRSFIEAFIDKYDLLIPIMAVRDWNMEIDELIIDKNVYDVENNKWVRDVAYPRKTIPTSWEAYKAFSKLLTISQEKSTGMITIELDYFSPEIAKLWLTNLIKEINYYIKELDQKEAQNSIDYLTKKLNEVNINNLQTVFYQLIEEQSKNIMLTQVKEEYVLKTVDPAQVPEEKDRPKRALIVILGTMFGGGLSLFFVLVHYFTIKHKN